MSDEECGFTSGIVSFAIGAFLACLVGSGFALLVEAFRNAPSFQGGASQELREQLNELNNPNNPMNPLHPQWN